MSGKRPMKRDLSSKKVTLKDLQAIQGGAKKKTLDKYPKPTKPSPAPKSAFKTWFFW